MCAVSVFSVFRRSISSDLIFYCILFWLSSWLFIEKQRGNNAIDVIRMIALNGFRNAWNCFITWISVSLRSNRCYFCASIVCQVTKSFAHIHNRFVKHSIRWFMCTHSTAVVASSFSHSLALCRFIHVRFQVIHYFFFLCTADRTECLYLNEERVIHS